MKLFELKSTIDWKWENHKDFDSAIFFTPKGKKYIVQFWYARPVDALMTILQNYNPEDVVEIEFMLEEHGREKVQLTGTGESAIVFATIIQIINEFIKVEQPSVVYYSASVSEHSRVKLYNFLTKRIFKSGWDLHTKFDQGHKWYVLTRS